MSSLYAGDYDVIDCSKLEKETAEMRKKSPEEFTERKVGDRGRREGLCSCFLNSIKCVLYTVCDSLRYADC